MCYQIGADIGGTFTEVILVVDARKVF